MSTIYTTFYDAFVTELAKHASDVDPEVRDGARSAATVGGVLGAVVMYSKSRAGKYKKVETLGSKVRRSSAKTRKLFGNNPELIVPAKRKVAAGVARSAARSIPAGLAAAFVAKKSYDVYRAANKA